MEKGTLTGKTDNGTTWTYTGDILNGEKHGKGKIVFSDGETYEGDFSENLPHGKGKGTSTDGYVYEGDFVDGEITKGKVTWPDGLVFEGDFFDGIHTGRGKITLPDVGVYEGEFANGVANGKGKMTHADGVIYEGDWVDDFIVKGKCTLTDGDVYEGYFNKDGEPHGKGKMTFTDGEVKEGDWIAGDIVKGKYIKTNGEFFEGKFVDGTVDKGTITTADGKVYDADEYFRKSASPKKHFPKLGESSGCLGWIFSILVYLLFRNWGGRIGVILGVIVTIIMIADEGDILNGLFVGIFAVIFLGGAGTIIGAIVNFIRKQINKY